MGRVKSASSVVAALTAGLLCVWAAFAAPPQGSRTVHGTVVDSGGRVLNGAVVQMKDTRTLAIRSFICRKDGTFRFSGLNPDVDYEFRGSYEGQWSHSKTVSRFESKPVVEIVLKIEKST